MRRYQPCHDMRILILALFAVCPLYAQSPSVVFSDIMDG